MFSLVLATVDFVKAGYLVILKSFQRRSRTTGVVLSCNWYYSASFVIAKNNTSYRFLKTAWRSILAHWKVKFFKVKLDN